MDSRPRKTTLESFNEELALLDRPLEGEVEYYDERPRRRQRWAVTSPVIIGSVFFAGAAVLFLSRPDPDTIIAAAQAAAARAPAAPQVTPAVAAPAAPAAEAPATPVPEPTTADETSTANAPLKLRSPPPRAAWIKLSGASRRHR